ncbi:ankyrin repeat domain-containing protein [Paenibacillus sp. HB172176]|uniref:ankyrin repeat domain-containing protein n=1 Tax=Paenibacillus sp. HB172176 TaxID=2493690 RepID=UPI0014397EE2|nr:ankyrin repeat domain-containing protein [Paenibacillus sp. HB172176]
MSVIPWDSELGEEVVKAIRGGDVSVLKKLLNSHPDLVHARIVGSEQACGGGANLVTRTLMHIATDWPGHLPNGAETLQTLIDAGADVNARFVGPHTETPLHWAASNDDVAALDVLLDAGAEIEATGAVIAGGTPLDDAVAFGQWKAARRLVERGAKTKLWHAAALGLMDEIKRYFSLEPQPAAEEITEAFWQACHGSQLEASQYLLQKGAELNWIGYDDLTPLDNARRSGADTLCDWLLEQGALTTEVARRYRGISS